MRPTPKPVLVTPPATLAVPLATLKTFLRVDGTDDDTILTVTLKAAIERVEKLIAKKLISQVWAIYFDEFPCGHKNDWWDGVREGSQRELLAYGDTLQMPFGPMSAVASVSTFDEDNSEAVFSSSNYYADTVGPVGKISLKMGAVWPSTVLRPKNGIKVQATFGYGAADTDVPNDIQLAVVTLAARMYEHRGDELPEVPEQVMTLLMPYAEIRI